MSKKRKPGEPKPAYPHIWSTVEAAGKNDPDRADAIGVGVRTIMRWRKGEWPDCFLYFLNHPPLHDAMGLEIADYQAQTTDKIGT